MALRGDRETTKWKNKLHPFAIYNIQDSILLTESHWFPYILIVNKKTDLQMKISSRIINRLQDG